MRKIYIVGTLLIAIGCSGTGDDAKSLTIETPDGNVAANKTTIEPFPQKIAAVTDAKLKRLESLGTEGPEFVAAYLGDVPEPSLKDYDRAFHAWQTSKTRQHSDEQVMEILGGYLGNRCIADFDMEWVTVTDEYGTNYAIRSKNVELMAFPFSTVMKRIEDNEHGFLNGVYYAIKQTLASGEYKGRDKESPAE